MQAVGRNVHEAKRSFDHIDRGLPPLEIKEQHVELPAPAVRLRSGSKGRLVVTANSDGDAYFSQSQVESMVAELASVKAALRRYHLELDMRRHAGVAADKALRRIGEVLQVTWEPGKEASNSHHARVCSEG